MAPDIIGHNERDQGRFNLWLVQMIRMNHIGKLLQYVVPIALMAPAAEGRGWIWRFETI